MRSYLGAYRVICQIFVGDFRNRARILAILMGMTALPLYGQDATNSGATPASLKSEASAVHRQRFEVLPGQRILLKGDSIVKGYAFGNYDDPSPLRTLDGIARILLADNLPHSPTIGPLANVWQGFNADGSPKTVDTLAGELQTNVRRGDLRPGDWLIYEDAGELDKVIHPAPWPSAKNMYLRRREALRGLALEADHSIGRDHVLMMTMFDYNPRAPWCAWDAPLDDGVHTGNDAVRDEAAALGVRVIDMNRIMDRAQDYIASHGWGRIVGPDGIHPNVYGNYVMVLAILGSLGGDIADWKIDGLSAHFRHPAAKGEVETIWGFSKDPTDDERLTMLNDLRAIVAAELQTTNAAAGAAAPIRPAAQSFDVGHSVKRMVRHGRILDHPHAQPEGTEKPCSYELGKLFQLDKESVLLAASLREQGGHDFEVGNDGFVFRDLSDIVPERAFPINRLDAGYHTPAGESGVLAKYPVNGGFMPRGAKLSSGVNHPAGGTGFFLSTAAAFLSDRSEMIPNVDHFLEFFQATWDGKALSVAKDKLPDDLSFKLLNVGFNCLPQDGGFLCPLVCDQGVVVVRFEHDGKKWKLVAHGKPFLTGKEEVEASIRKLGEDFIVYTRGRDPRGRIYRSHDGLNYYLAFDHWNHTVPQGLNQGLDGSLYLATNTGPGMLRNPLLAFALHGQTFANPIVVHDEKQIGDDRGAETPFCDHGIGENVFLQNRWRHFLLYRVCELKETNGKGAPPTPYTGLYVTEFEYGSVTAAPFAF